MWSCRWVGLLYLYLKYRSMNKLIAIINMNHIILDIFEHLICLLILKLVTIGSCFLIVLKIWMWPKIKRFIWLLPLKKQFHTCFFRYQNVNKILIQQWYFLNRLSSFGIFRRLVLGPFSEYQNGIQIDSICL